MGDSEAHRVRERVWVEKVDMEADPPRVVERLFIEDGVVAPADESDTGNHRAEEEK